MPAIAVADALRAEGAQVSFVGGQRAEAELVPAAGYPLDPIRVEGISRSNPLKAARAVAQGRAGAEGRPRDPPAPRRGRGAGGRRLRRRPGRRRGAGAADPARPHRGRLAPRAEQPPARTPRRARLPRLPARGPHRRPLPRHRPPGPGARRRPRRCARSSSGSARRSAACSSSAARSARAASTTPPSPRSPTRPTASSTSPGRRDFPDLAAPGAHYDLRDYLVPFGLALAAADLAVARAGGSIFELAQYGLPAVLIPYPHATADHQSANARWMEQGGAATVIADAALTPAGLRAAVDAILLDDARLPRWPPPPSGSPARTPPATSPTPCWGPCRDARRRAAASARARRRARACGSPTCRTARRAPPPRSAGPRPRPSRRGRRARRPRTAARRAAR